MDFAECWRPLTEWLTGHPGAAARDLVGGIEPENPSSRRELLVLALLAVSVDAQRLSTEFARREFLDGSPVTLDRLVERQQHLTENVIGTSGPLNTLSRLIYERATPYGRTHMAIRGSGSWDDPDRQEADVIWGAAVRFGHLAQTIAHALGYGGDDRIRFYRTLLLGDSDPHAVLINAVGCVAQPWSSGTRGRQTQINSDEHPHSLFEVLTAPAGIIAVTHIDTDRALEKHPSKFASESGHPVIAAYPPLAYTAAQHYRGPAGGLAGWRHISASEMRNH